MRIFPRPLQGFDHVQTRTILKAQIDHCERRRLFLEVFPRLGDAANGRHIEAALGQRPREASAERRIVIQDQKCAILESGDPWVWFNRFFHPVSPAEQSAVAV